MAQLRRAVLAALLPVAACFSVREVQPIDSKHGASRLALLLSDFPRSAAVEDISVSVDEEAATPVKLLHQLQTTRLVVELPLGSSSSAGVVTVNHGKEHASGSWREGSKPVQILNTPAFFEGPMDGGTEFKMSLSHWPGDVSAVGSFVAKFGKRSGRVVSVMRDPGAGRDSAAVHFVIAPPASMVAGQVAFTLGDSETTVTSRYLYTNPELPLDFSGRGPKSLMVHDMPVKFAVRHFPDVDNAEHVLVHFGDQKVAVQTATKRHYSHNTTETWLNMLPPLPSQKEVDEHMRSGKDVVVPVTVTPILLSSTDEVAAPNFELTTAFYFSYEVPLAPTTARFYGGNYREIRIKFNMPVDKAESGRVAECHLLLGKETLKAVSDAKTACSWLDPHTLRLKLSQEATLKPGEKVYLHGDTLHPKSNRGITSPLTLPDTDVAVEEDPDYDLPDAIISGPSTVSDKLNELMLDGSYSTGSRLSFSWGCSNPDVDSSLKRLPSSARHVKMPGAAFLQMHKAGKPLKFSLIVTDSLGRKSLPQYHTVDFSAADAPIIQIDGPKKIVATTATNIVAQARAVNVNTKSISFFWEEVTNSRQTNNVKDIFMRGSVLRIPPNSLVAGKHQFRVVGFVEGLPKLLGSAIITVDLTAVEQDEVSAHEESQPEGGSCGIHPASGHSHSTLFTISCANWYDPAEFESDSTSHLRYVYRYRASPNRRWTVLQITSPSPNAQDFMLPSGRYNRSSVQLEVAVIGQNGASAVWQGEVQVAESFPPETASLEDVTSAISLLNSEEGVLLQSIRGGDLSRALNMIDLTAMFAFHPALKPPVQGERRLAELQRRLSTPAPPLSAGKLLEYLVRLADTVILDPQYYDPATIASMVRTLATISLRSGESGTCTTVGDTTTEPCQLSMEVYSGASGKYKGNRWNSDVGQAIYLAVELAKANDLNVMPIEIATDLWTVMTNLLTEDTMTRGRSASWNTCNGCSGNFTEWLEFTKESYDSIISVMRRWSLTTFTPASDAIVINADSPDELDFFGDFVGKKFEVAAGTFGSAQIAFERLYLADLAAGNVSCCETITAGNATFAVDSKLASVFVAAPPSGLGLSIIDASAFVFPVFYEIASSRNFFGHMYGVAFSDPAATGELYVADLEHPINMTVTLEPVQDGWEEGRYAACRYWNGTLGDWSESGVRNKAYNWYDELQTGFPEHGPQVVCLMEHLTEFAIENIVAPPTPPPPTPVPTSVPTPWPTVDPRMYPPHWVLGFQPSFTRPHFYALRSEGQNKTLFNEEDPPVDVEHHLLVQAGANETVTSSLLTIKEVSNEPSPIYPEREDPESARIVYAGVVRGAGPNGITIPMEIEYKIRVAHVGTQFDPVTGFVTNNGGACLARMLTIKSTVDALYPVVPLRILLPHSAGQVVMYPWGSTKTDYLPWAQLKTWLVYGEMDMNDGFYVASYTQQPWNTIQHGIQEPYELAGYCTSPEPSLELLSTCYLNPSLRYGCPFKHPGRSGTYEGWYLPLVHGSSLPGSLPLVPTAAPTEAP